MRYDWEKDRWNDFLNRTEGKDIVIWGAGQTAFDVIPILEQKKRILAVVDSDPVKIGKSFCGYQITNPDKVSNLLNDKDLTVLICSMYLTDIANKLDSMGISDYYSGFFMLRRDLENEKMRELPSDDELRRLKSILSDKESERIVDYILEKRKKGIIDYSDLISRPEYLRDDLFTFTDDEIYVDAGAYDGDTIMQFIKKVRCFRKIVAFEANNSNYQRMLMNLGLADAVYGGEKLQLFHAAVGECEGVISITTNGNESATAVLDDRGNLAREEVRCVALDDLVDKATYIKMDIEGYEAEAIRGAEKLIKNNRPKMAVCIYHRPRDLWELPIMISELVPDYKLYIRHHGNIYYDTVLYATV